MKALAKRLTRKNNSKDKRRSSCSSAASTTEADVSSRNGGSCFPRPRCVGFRLDVSDLSTSFRDFSVRSQPSDPYAEQLARKVAKLEDTAKSESWQLRQHKRKERINQARTDYLECLEALNQSLTSLDSSTASTTPEKALSRRASEEFFTENGLLDWKGYELWEGGMVSFTNW